MGLTSYSLNDRKDWDLLRRKLQTLCENKTPFTLSKEDGIKRIVLTVPSAEELLRNQLLGK